MTIHRKRTRLSSREYLGRKAYFVTICCDGRARYLKDSRSASAVLQLLIECAARKSFSLHAYCLMPDHMHVLAQGMDDVCDLLEFVRLFKQRTAFAFRSSCGKQLWEMGFYDYVLRSSDSVEAVAAYIWWNPSDRAFAMTRGNFHLLGRRRYIGSASRKLDGFRLGSWNKQRQKRGSKDPPLQNRGDDALDQ